MRSIKKCALNHLEHTFLPQKCALTRLEHTFQATNGLLQPRSPDQRNSWWEAKKAAKSASALLAAYSNDWCQVAPLYTPWVQKMAMGLHEYH